jgi:phytoene dehydrogenase-like protein
LAGFHLDSCSTGHTLIQTNPVIVDDELGLIAEHGLAYIEPDPVAHVVFPDGESLTMWLDLERTCEEIARFSAVDGQAYRRLLAEYDAVKDVFGRQRFTPVGLGLSSGWPSRPGSPSTRRVRGRWPTRSSSGVSVAAGRFRAAARGNSLARWSPSLRATVERSAVTAA